MLCLAYDSGSPSRSQMSRFENPVCGLNSAFDLVIFSLFIFLFDYFQTLYYFLPPTYYSDHDSDKRIIGQHSTVVCRMATHYLNLSLWVYS